MAEFEDGAQQQPNLGGMITEKVMDGINNLDLGEFLQNLVAATPENAEEEAARGQLQEIFKKFQTMSPEEKEHFSSQIKTMIASKMTTKLKEKMSGLDLEGAIGDAIMFRLYMVAAIVVFVIVLLVFFGYKLYKSIKEKEIKREEKKKAKLMKKKK